MTRHHAWDAYWSLFGVWWVATLAANALDARVPGPARVAFAVCGIACAATWAVLFVRDRLLRRPR